MSVLCRLCGTIKHNVKNRPMIKGMVVYSITWPIGCFVEQTVKSEEINYSRIVKFSLYGSLYVAPGIYWWMKFCCRVWPKPTFVSTITKAFIEQFTYGPFAISSFLLIMTLLERGSLEEGISDVKEKFFPTWKVSAVVWPAIQTVNYSFISEKNRVPFLGLCSMMWTIFLTFVKYEHHEKHETIE